MSFVRSESIQTTPQRSAASTSWPSDSGSTRLTARRLLAGSAIHSSDFDMSRCRSALHLTTCGRLIVQEGSVCSLSLLTTRRMVALTATGLVGLICVPGLALAAIVGDDGNRIVRLVLLAFVWSIAVVGIAACVRTLVDGSRWRDFAGTAIVISNLAVARRRQGLGRALLDDVVRFADDGGYRLLLMVRADNVAALRLYRSVGFVTIESNRPNPGQLAMERSTAAVGRMPASRRRAAAALFGMFGGVALAVLAGATSATWSARIAVVCALWLLCSAAVVDLRTTRLPNRLVVVAAVCAVLAVMLAGTHEMVLIAAGMGATPFLLVHLLDPAAFGFGDVKFAAVAGALMATWWWPAAVVMSLATLVTACLVRMFRPHGPLPLGPSLFAGTSVATLLSIVLVQNGLVS